MTLVLCTRLPVGVGHNDEYMIPEFLWPREHNTTRLRQSAVPIQFYNNHSPLMSPSVYVLTKL